MKKIVMVAVLCLVMITSVMATNIGKMTTTDMNPTTVAHKKNPCNNPWSVHVDCPQTEPEDTKQYEETHHGGSNNVCEYEWLTINGMITPKVTQCKDVFKFQRVDWYSLVKWVTE